VEAEIGTTKAYFTIAGYSEGAGKEEVDKALREHLPDEDAETIISGLERGNHIDVESDGGTDIVHFLRGVGLLVETHAYLWGGM